MSESCEARANKVKKGLKGGTSPARTKSLVMAAAKSAGHGKGTKTGNAKAQAAKSNGVGGKKKFK